MSVRKDFALLLSRGCKARKIRQLLEAGARWLGLCLPGLGLLLLLALLLPPTRLWSAVMAWAALLWIASTLAGLLLVPLVRPLRLPAYALWLERRAGLPRNELINALQLESQRARWEGDPISRQLVERSRRRGIATMGGLPWRSLHAERAIGPHLGRGFLGLLPFLAVWLLAPVRFTDAVDLFLCAGSASVVPVVELRVTPGNQKVQRGSSVQIQALVSGRRRPKAVQVEMRRPGGGWIRAEMVRDEALRQSGQDGFLFLASALNGDLEYRVRAGWVRSPDYRIRVLEHLQALGYRKLYEPPAYTGMPLQREVSSNGDLAALTGTRVTLEVRHRRPGAVGNLLFTAPAGALGPGAVRSVALRESAAAQLSASMLLRESGTYRVELRDEAEGDGWVSDTFHIKVVPDLEPAVRLLSPPEAIELPPDMRVTLIIDCVDDFGLTELALVHGRPGDDPTRATLAEWEQGKEARVTYNWNLEEVQLLPGQELHYYLQVLDNDPLNGPKVGETEVFTIRFPSIAEMYANAEEKRREEIVTLEDALETQEQLRRELQKVAQEMLREDKISWEKEQEIEGLLEQQEDLAEKVEQIQQSLGQSRQRMENQNLFSMEMIDKVQEIQDLARQIQGEEFRQLLQRMHQALQEVDRQELQKAMEQMKITQEEISKTLDRTLQMLRQLLAEERIDRILQMMAELQARQEEINRQLEMGATPPEASEELAGAEQQDSKEQEEGQPPDSKEGQPPDSLDEAKPLSEEEASDLAAQQEALRRELEKLRKELEALMEESKGSLERLSQALDRHLKDPAHKETQDQMRQAQEAMEQSQRGAALKFGRKAKQGIQQMQANLSQMKMQTDFEKQEEIARALYEISNRMVKVSQRQEQLVAAAERMGPREMAVREQELYDEIRAVSDSLFQVSKETPVLSRGHLRALGEVLREMARARDLFEEGRRRTAVSMADESTRSLNMATKKLLEAANQAQSACAASCASPFNQMQSLTGQQCALNEQMKQMMGSMQMPRPTLGQGEAMMRMAARQEMVRQGLSEIREELEGSGKLMGDLGQVIEEMEELVRDLRARKVESRIVERQEKILSRMLSAQRSIRKRDESERRRSRAGVNPQQRSGPGPVDAGRSRAEILQRAMLRGSQDPVPAEYRGMVERYMRCLLRGSR